MRNLLLFLALLFYRYRYLGGQDGGGRREREAFSVVVKARVKEASSEYFDIYDRKQTFRFENLDTRVRIDSWYKIHIRVCRNPLSWFRLEANRL
jgi:hypothetical protein